MLAQEEFHYPMYVQNISYSLSFLYAWVFIGLLDWRIAGVAMVRNLCDLTALVFILVIVRKRYVGKPTLVAFQLRNLRGSLQYLKLSIPMGIVIHLEWTFFELQTVIIGLTNNTPAFAAHSSFASIVMLFFMIPAGLASSINSFMGNLIGDHQVRAAQVFNKVAMWTMLLVSLLAFGLSLLIRPFLQDNFSTGPEMKQYFTQVYNFYAFCYLFADGYQVVLGSILRSIGQQNYAAVGFLAIYYILGIPLSLLLVFQFKLGMIGAWYTLGVVSWLVSLLFTLRILQNNWDHSVNTVSEMLNRQSISSAKLVELQQLHAN